MRMKIIISPAKKMTADNDWMEAGQMPCFLSKAEKIHRYLNGLTLEELKDLWKCSHRLASSCEEQLRHMDLHRNLTPALLAYQGIQYQYMAPQVFTDSQWAYAEKSLRILSGFYGILRPLDGVVPYRLEMQAKARVGESRDLYDFWGEDICREAARDTDVILNLASKEYSRCVEAFQKKIPPVITCVFGELRNGKVVQNGTRAKMARGEMARYLTAEACSDLETVKQFSGLDYHFCQELSDGKRYVFIAAHSRTGACIPSKD